MSLAKITEGLKFAGDVSIRKLEIVGSNNYIIDITKQVVKINVYEDLFSPFTTLSIVVRESVDFITALPLKGEEIINVEIGTPTMVKQEHIIKGKFYIYKLSDRMEMNKSLQYMYYIVYHMKQWLILIRGNLKHTVVEFLILHQKLLEKTD